MPADFFHIFANPFSNLTLYNFYLLYFAKFIKFFYWNGLYFASLLVSNSNFCIFANAFSRLPRRHYDRAVLLYEEIEELFLLRVGVYDLKP